MQSFTDFLRDLKAGSIDRELSEELADVLQSVQESGKDASLTFSVTLKHAGEGRVFVVPKIDTKKPKPPQMALTLFVTPEGNLSRRDPRQLSMADLQQPDYPTAPKA